MWNNPLDNVIAAWRKISSMQGSWNDCEKVICLNWGNSWGSLKWRGVKDRESKDEWWCEGRIRIIGWIGVVWRKCERGRCKDVELRVDCACFLCAGFLEDDWKRSCVLNSTGEILIIWSEIGSIKITTGLAEGWDGMGCVWESRSAVMYGLNKMSSPLSIVAGCLGKSGLLGLLVLAK